MTIGSAFTRYAWMRAFTETDPYVSRYATGANPLGSVPVTGPCKRWQRIHMDTIVKYLYLRLHFLQSWQLSLFLLMFHMMTLSLICFHASSTMFGPISMQTLHAKRTDPLDPHLSLCNSAGYSTICNRDWSCVVVGIDSSLRWQTRSQ